jgi:hypothetical protein
MTPTNVFLIPLPAGFPNAGKAVADICRRTNGLFRVETSTVGQLPRWRLYVRSTGAAA